MTSQPGDLAQLLRTVRLALQQENYPEAINALEQAVALATEAGDHAAQARHLGNLALIYYRGGQPDAALAAFDQALTNARTDGSATRATSCASCTAMMKPSAISTRRCLSLRKSGMCAGGGSG